MTLDPAPQKKPTTDRPERQPIAVETLLIAHTNNGVRGIIVPGKSGSPVHTLTAGTYGDVKTEIEWRPWMRMFRVAVFTRVNGGTGKPDRWEPAHKPYYIPETWAVHVPVEE